MKKFIQLIITLFLFNLFANIQVYAQETNVIARDEWQADESILTENENYNFPKKIVVIPINIKTDNSTSTKDMKDLYYYFATRSGFGDLPFHFAVGDDGAVFEGNKLGPENQVQLTAESQRAVVVVYFSRNFEEFSISAVDSLEQILLRQANKYAISADKIQLKGINYSFGNQLKLEEVKLVDIAAKWKSQFNSIKSDVLDSYNPEQIQYKAEIVKSEIPKKEQEMNTIVELKIKVKNTGDFNFYSGETSNLFIVRDDPFDQRSYFYTEESWSSPSRIVLLEQGEVLFKEEEKEFTFKIRVPLYPSKHTEKFVLVAPDGQRLKGTEFSISLNMKPSDNSIIEISETPVGYLNVRSTPGLGEIVTKVAPGERFIPLDYQNGYYKIEANGKEGWVVNTYIKKIQ